MNIVQCKFVDADLNDHDKSLLLPKRQSKDASGFDLASAHRENLLIGPGERVLVATGIAISLPSGHEAQIRSRSGLALKNGIIVLNSPGTIDADYRGEIKVILANLSCDPFTVSFGMRIAQMVVASVVMCELSLVSSLKESSRGDAGFGSTGLIEALGRT